MLAYLRGPAAAAWFAAVAVEAAAVELAPAAEGSEAAEDDVVVAAAADGEGSLLVGLVMVQPSPLAVD